MVLFSGCWSTQRGARMGAPGEGAAGTLQDLHCSEQFGAQRDLNGRVHSMGTVRIGSAWAPAVLSPDVALLNS